jgi:hypothetical protein
VKRRPLATLVIAATAATFSLSIAATPPPARMTETFASISQFAATSTSQGEIER